MRAIAVVAAALTVCAWAYGCGGASDAFVPGSGDSGVDGAVAHGTGDGDAQDPGSTANTGAGDDAAGSPEIMKDGGGHAPATGDEAAAPSSDGGTGVASDGAALGDGSAPDGPVGGRITCGKTTCATSTQFCCAAVDGGASCQTSEQACLALAGVPRQCEKTADCPANDVCCYEFSSVPATTSCHANDCNGGNGMRVEACRSQSDCATGTCATHACITGGSIQSCAAFGMECP